MRNPITLKELRLFERFLSAFLILTLIVPSPVYALREIQEGAAESQEISRALTGLEETEEDRITRLAFEEVLRRRGPRSPWARSRWNQALQQKARVQQASAPAFSSGTVAPDWFSIVKPAPTSPTMPVPQINPHAWRPENLPPILADLKEHGIAKVVIGGLVLTVLLAENPDFLYLDLIWESTLAGPVYLGRIDLDISSKYEVVARGAFPREHFQGKAAWYYKDALAEADPGIFRTYRSDSEGWNRVSMLEQALYVRDSVVKRLQWRRQWIERFLIFIALEHLKDRDWLVVDPGNDHSQLLVLLSSYMQGIFAQDYRCFIPQVRKRFADMLKKTPRRAGLEEKDWRAVRVSAIRDGPRYALGRTQSQRTRAVGALMRLGLRTLGEVYARSPRELVGRDGLGEGGIAWLRELFKGWGATWDETWRDPWQSLTDDQQKVLAALYDRWPKRRPYLIAWLALCRLLHHLPLNGELMLVLQQMAEASVDRVRFTSYRAKMVKTLRASEVPQWLETIPHPYRHVDALNLACQAKLPEALEQARYDLEALSRGASTATIHPNVQASAQTTPAILTPWHLQFTQEVLPEAQRRWREIAASLQASRAKQVYNGLVHSLAYREITGRWPNPTQLAEWLGTRPARGAKLSQALTRQFAPLAAHAPEWSFVRPAARIHRDTSPLHRDHIDRVRAELDTFLEHRPPLSAPPMSPATLHEGIVHQPDNVSPNETSPQTLASALTREKRGLQLRSLRESLGLTQAEFGAAVRPEDPIFLTQISRYENGRIVGVPDWLMEQAQQLVREKKRQEALALAIARADEEWTARYPAEVPSAEPSSGATPEEPSAATPVDTTVAPVVRHPWHVQLEQEVPTDVQLRWLAIAAALRAGRAQQVYRAFIHCLACREQLGRWPNSAELHRWLGVRGPRGSELYYELHQRFAPLADEAPDWVFAPPTGRLRHEPVVLDNVARVREELDARLAAASDHLPQPPESRGGALSLVARLREHPGGETTAVALAAWVPMTFSAFRYFRYLELLAAEDAQRGMGGCRSR